jgi:alanyl-tRNA synthetase
MALFGEKYGDVVRVVSAGDFSVEFCGGTHVKNTANLGLFRIRQEGSVAAGVRRIEALTGMGVLKYINGMSAVIMDVCSLLKIANPKAVVEGVQKAEQLIKEQQREINELNSKLAVAQIGQLFAGTTEENGVRVVTGRIDKANADILRTMCEKARDFAPKCVCVLATENDGKVTFAAACGKEALALGANAGKIIKAVAQKAGGNGGGKPDMAMAGAKQPEKISEALDSVKETVYAMLK